MIVNITLGGVLPMPPCEMFSSVYEEIRGTGPFGTVSELSPVILFLTVADEGGFAVVVQSVASASLFCCHPSGVAKTMKTKTWTVVTNTGKQADLESGLEKREVQKPTHISAREFVHWLAPGSHIDNVSLGSLFKL
jgi:hypothetical protein